MLLTLREQDLHLGLVEPPRGRAFGVGERGGVRKYPPGGAGIAFCRSVYATTPMGDVVPIEGGLEAGLPDVVAVPDLATIRPISWEPGVAHCIADVYNPDWTPSQEGPRNVLKRVVKEGRREHALVPIALSRRCRTAAAIAVSPRDWYSEASAWVDSGSSSKPTRSCSASPSRPCVTRSSASFAAGCTHRARRLAACIARKPLGQHPVGHLPLSRRDEHLRAAGVAEAEHRHVVVRGDPPLDRLPPLLDALPVGGELARRYPGAYHVADSLEGLHLTAGRSRERLVDLGHPGRDVPRRAASIARVRVPRDLGRSLRPLGPGERQPCALGHVARVPQQTICPRAPSRANGRVTVRSRELP